MRIGILGGTFNPIHNTHLAIAAAARDQFALDLLLFIPAKTPPHKRADLAIAPPEHRLRMTQLAVRSLPGAEVEDLELNRPGPSYTFDTLTALRQRFGPDAEFFFILGSDQALDLPRWHRASELIQLTRFILIARPGYPLAALDAVRRKLQGLRLDPLDVTPSTLSATEIRRRLAENLDVSDLLPQPVLEYIREQDLYRPR